MPAYPDKELILAVAAQEMVREQRMDQLEQYIIACDLSRGPDPDRAEHWTAKSVELKIKLQAAMKPPEPPNTNTEVITCSPAHNP